MKSLHGETGNKEMADKLNQFFAQVLMVENTATTPNITEALT